MPENSNSPKLFGYLAALTFTFIFCMHYLVAKEILQHVDIYSLASMRGIIGGGILLIICRRRLGNLSKALVGRCIFIGIFGFALNQLLFLQGLKLTTPTQAAVLANLIPLFACLAAMIAGVEKFNKRIVGGITLGFTAVSAYLVGENYTFEISSNAQLLGNTLIILNVVSLAIALVLIRKTTSIVDSTTITGVMLLVGGVIILPFASPNLSQFWSASLSKPDLFTMVLFEVVISTSLAYLLNVQAIKILAVSATTSVAYFQPVFTGVLVYLWYDTFPSLKLLALFCAVTLANIIVSKGRS